jgi:tRNA modification GTPase
VKRSLIELIAALEAGIDFAEDDLDLMPDDEICRRINAVASPLASLAESFAYGRLLREGFRLAIVGRPNAGKSSLFNRLIGRERSIVTAQAGTTRDTVAERLELSGIPVEMVDTAGLRDVAASGAALDEAEALGVTRSREAMAEADVLLLILAADEISGSTLHPEDREVIAGAAGRRLIVALNKVDLVQDRQLALLPASSVPTSAIQSIGIAELRLAILGALQAAPGVAESVPVTNLRQQTAITNALIALRSAEQGLTEATPHEMLLLDLHEALAALDLLTGTTHTEDILEVIFGSFCIGK